MCSNAFKVACSSPGELEGPLLNSSRRPALKPVALAGVAGEDERLIAQWCFENLPLPPTPPQRFLTCGVDQQQQEEGPREEC